jgi:hypothetical protein
MSESPSKSRTSRLGVALRVLAGLAVGVALSEVAFHLRDDGAFPHLNLYAPDATLGVRLLPGESMRLSFGGNPVSEVRINSEGFRGADFPEPGADEVLVVGDSQVFGLGVEENETFSARLEGLMPGVRVMNAGVPTYGPLEFERVIAHLIEKRKPKRVVYVVNFANDLFEAERPNTERHAVWDGWAVRRETAPAHVASFPGRDLLFRKSHAFFALRKWWYRRSGPTEAFSVPSEGTFKDIAGAAARAADEHVRARDDSQRLAKLRDTKVGAANAELRGARDSFVELVTEEQLGGGYQKLEAWSVWNPLKAAFAQPGDIVGVQPSGEATGPLFATADIILKGAEVRRRVEQQLRDKAKASAEAAAKIEPVLERLADAQKRTDAVRAEKAPRIRAWSPIAPSVRRVKALCDAAGARLFVVALPLDVQIDKGEWKKYGVEPIDLEPARILVDDVIDAAEEAGATGIDLTATLRAAQPGAFLDRDIHLTPKGHEAVAKALATALAAPPAVRLPEPDAGRPPGRTLPTPLAAARARNEVAVSGSTNAGCETYIVDEWLTLRCHDRGEDRAVPVGVQVVASPLGEWAIYEDSGAGQPARTGPPALVVQVPLLRGERTVVDFRWPKRGRRLDVSWDEAFFTVARSKDGNVSINFSDLSADDTAKIPPAPKPSEAVCAAVKAAGLPTPCGEMPLFENPACFSTYRDDEKGLVACLLGEREAGCKRGTAPVGVFQRCVPLCAKEAPCKAGVCTAYAGAEVCL